MSGNRIAKRAETPKNDPWLQWDFSLDLCAAARLLHQFLRSVDDNGKLYEADYVLNAIRRYETFWVPLKLIHREEHLIAPLDVQWVWLVHMLCPLSYQTDCSKITGGQVISRSFVPTTSEESDKCETITMSLWKQMIQNEPYDFELSMQLNRGNDVYAQISAYDICAAVQRQREFNYQTNLPHFSFPTFLKKGLERYKKYLYLQQLCKGKKFLTPTYDIDLIWHTHPSYPVEYHMDMKKHLGYLLNHDDSDSDRSPDSRLVQAQTATRELWEKTFSELYAYPGAMYRGYPCPLTQSPRLFTPISLRTSFDFVTVLDSVRLSDVLLPAHQQKVDITVIGSESSKIVKLCKMKLHLCHDNQFESTHKCNIDLNRGIWAGQPPGLVTFRISAYSGIGLLGRKNLQQMQSECSYDTLVHDSITSVPRSLSLTVTDASGSLTDGKLELNTSIHTTAIFDLNLNAFERLTLDDSGKTYQFCLSTARKKDIFKDSPTVVIANHM